MSDQESDLWARLIRVAEQRYDGHLSILKFTTNWRVGFITPGAREDVDELAVGETFIQAAEKALAGQEG